MRHATVVGAGIAGLAIAAFLGRAGFRVRVLERAPGPSSEGAGIQVSPNAAHVLAALGALPALRERSVAPERIDLFDGEQRLSSFQLGAAIENRYGVPYLLAERATVRDCIAAQLPSNVSIEYGARFEATEGLTIGADGVGSTVRQTVSGIRAEDTGRTAWRRTSSTGSEPVTKVHLAPDEHRVAYPLPGGTNEVWIRPSHLPPPGPNWQPWPVLRVNPNMPWHRGETVLIGDAAHAMPPYAAQGGALALEDAAVLAAALIEHDEARVAFAAYERVRRPRVAAVARLTDANRRIYHMKGLARLARNLAMRAAPQRALQRRMAWIYGWTPRPIVRSSPAPSR